MIQARIYKPAKIAMQSGKARTRQWVLEFCPKSASSFIDSLMGWHGSRDTLHHLRLTFPSLDAALAYAKEKDISVQIDPPHSPLATPKKYANNFRYDRVG